jgi:2-polyprenyl-6-hydroxyphenyl methylase / 3-demethylubiquinone-9 3-methyltransferase
MAIDNEVYNRLGGTWWDEDNPLNMLHGSMTPGRFGYFRDTLARLGRDPAGLRALDIGCGGGFLAEEFDRLGCRVTGVDPSAVSIETARRHAAETGRRIDYLVGSGEQLPVDDASFDLVYCCDVLEHVSDLDRVIAETARVLRPGGTYFFDTINRTTASKILVIKVMQEWRATRIIDTTLHVWDMFITPAELTATMRRHGLEPGEITGLGPRTAKARLLLDFVRAKRGRISYGELSRRMDAGPVKDTSASYMGYATRAGT